MSLQKVVSNYYVDLLDYLGSKYRKSGGNFDVYFSSLNSDGKKQLISKVASVFQRIDILRNSQSQFWKAKIRNQTAFILIVSIMIFVTAIVMIYLFLADVRSGELFSTFQRNAAIITYIIVFLIIFTIFLLIIINISENKKQSEAQRGETVDNLNSLQNLFDIGNATQLPIVLRFIGYKNTENKVVYQGILNSNEATIKELLKTGGAPAAADAGFNKPKSKKFVIKDTDGVDFDKVYDKYGDALRNSIKNFYNSGFGYTDVRKEVIASSNILIMKEFKRIMEYYYKLLKRKNNAQALTNEKVNDVLDKYVIKEINMLGKLLAPMNQNAFVDVNSNDENTRLGELQEYINLNYKDEEFNIQLSYVDSYIAYIMIYATQIYLKKPATDASFDPILKTMMPQFLDTTTMTLDVDFFTDMKTAFMEHERTKLPKMLETAKLATTTSLDPLYLELLESFKLKLDPYYQNVMLNLKGDFYFPFSSWYYKSLTLKYLDTIKPTLTAMKLDIAKDFIKVYGDQFIPSYWRSFKESFKDIDSRKESLIARIAGNMEKFENIRLMDNQPYISGKVQKTPDTEPVIYEILLAVDQQVQNRKLSEKSSVGNKSNASRFLEMDKFTEELDKITYMNLKVGLNLDFFSDILDRFYFSVNTSIYSGGNTGDRKTKDIYFNTNKRFKLSNIALIFGTVIVSLALVYNFMRVTEEFRLAKKAKAMVLSEEKDPTKQKYLNREFTEHNLNIWMKGVIPIAFGIFFVCLMFSVYKKSQTKFRFNKETIDTNTSELRAALNDLTILFETYDGKVPLQQRTQTLKNLRAITIEDKTSIYEKLKIVVDKFEKCNYVVMAQKSSLPFPYTEIIIDAFMITVIVLCIFWVLGQIGPIDRIKKIRTLNMMKEKGTYSNGTKEWTNEAFVEASCHDNEMDSIMYTLKILFFMFIVLFLIFYATKVLTSTSEFEYGIYNSMYFEDSLCID